MGNGWPVVKLGEVAAHRKEFVPIDDTQEYKRCRVQLHAKGVVLRDIITGAQIKTKNQQVCRTGEFLVAEIDAKVGGYGIVPKELDGAIVSSHYFLFVVNAERLDWRFLDYFVRTPAFREQVRAQGSTNYAAVRPAQVLAYEIPLPALAEQRRIVAKVEELAAKIEEARRLRTQVAVQVERLFHAVSNRLVSALSDTFSPQPLSRLVDTKRGISYGVVLTGSPVDDGVPTLRAGDLQRFEVRLGNVKRIDPATAERYRRTKLCGNELLLRIRGGLGEVAVCPPEMVGGNVSREIAVIPVTPSMLPHYVMYVLAAPSRQEQMLGHVRGTSYKGINLKDVRTLPIPVPPLPEQRRIVAYLDDLRAKVDAIKALQAKTAAELDALLPSILDRAFKGEL